MAREVSIKFLGDESDLSRASKQAGDDLDRFSKRAGTIGGVVAGVTTAALNAAAAGARAVGTFVKGAIGEAEQAQQMTQVTAALLKSTGNAANVSGKQVGALTQHLSNLSGIDDEVIQAGTNVMLTFRNVRNEAGKGNKIFDRSQQAALDLSAVLGTDLKSANIQLGKALNDPIKGVTALGRAGVQFTQSQKDQIKALVTGNDLLGAQKIILGEVETQVGGAAAANSTATQRMATAWSNFKESIGTEILPAFTAITDVLGNTVLPALVRAFDATIAAVKRIGAPIVDAFLSGFKGADFTPADGFAGAVQRIAQAAGKGLADAITNLKALGQWAKDNSDALTVAAAALGAFALALGSIGAVHTTTSALTSVGSSLLSIAGSLGPVGLVIAAVVALGVAAFVAYQKIQPFRDAVDGLVQAFDNLSGPLKVAVIVIAAAFAPLLAVILTVREAVQHWDEITAIAQRVWGAVTDAVSTAMDTVRPIVASVVGFLVSVWARYGDEVMGIITAVGELFAAIWNRIVQVARIVAAILTPVFDVIAAVWQAALIIIQTAITVFVAIVQQLWALWGDELLRVIQTVWNLIANTVEGALRVVQGVIQIVTGIISGDWGKAWDGVVNVFSGVVQQIKAIALTVIAFFQTAWSGLTSLITAPFDAAKKAVGAVLDGFGALVSNAFDTVVRNLKSALNDVVDILNAMIRGYNSIPFAPNIPQIPTVKGAPAPAASRATGVQAFAPMSAPALLGARAAAVAPAPVAVSTRPIVINLPEGTNGHTVIEAVRRYERRNGQGGWRTR